MSGEVSRKHTEINGKKEGKMTDYYKDGKVKSERMFENDLQVGKSVYFYPTGEVKENQYYESGKLNGGILCFMKTVSRNLYATGIMDCSTAIFAK